MTKDIRVIKVGSEWLFWELAGDINFAYPNGEPITFEVIEYGEDLIGASFVVLKNSDEPDLVASFVLTSTTSAGGYSFKCIYSDFEDQ